MNYSQPVLHLFLPDGIPEGLQIIEKANWSGIGLLIPRQFFAKHKNRDDLQKPGVYLLIGDMELAPKIYVGEGDPLYDRVQSHDVNKNFWDTLIAFTSKDRNLNKATIQYLEARLYQIAKRSGRFEVMNKNTPAKPSLSDMDLANSEEYLRDLLLCLPILGVPLNKEAPKKTTNENDRLFIKTKGIVATGLQTKETFWVFKGSQAMALEQPSCPPTIKARRQSMIDQGLLQKEQDALIFTKDCSFTSSSTPASLILGRAANGRVSWKDEQERSIKDLEAQS